MPKTNRVAVLALMLATMATAAAAQERNAQTAPLGALPYQAGAAETTGSGATAPIGHRQPTEGNLTAGIRKEERQEARAPIDPLGPLPHICKDC